jgi:hypothetical protein
MILASMIVGFDYQTPEIIRAEHKKLMSMRPDLSHGFSGNYWSATFGGLLLGFRQFSVGVLSLVLFSKCLFYCTGNAYRFDGFHIVLQKYLATLQVGPS